MRTIHKFELEDDQTLLRLPPGAEILSVKLQRDAIQLWALVEVGLTVDAPPRCVVLMRTGAQISNLMRLKFLDTILIADGTVVLHAFEILP